MKRCHVWIMVLAAIMVASAAFAAENEFFDVAVGSKNPDGEMTFHATTPTLAGPYYVSYCYRPDSDSLVCYFTSGKSYTSTYANRQEAVLLGLRTNQAVYLYASDNQVYGVVVLVN